MSMRWGRLLAIRSLRADRQSVSGALCLDVPQSWTEAQAACRSAVWMHLRSLPPLRTRVPSTTMTAASTKRTGLAGRWWRRSPPSSLHRLLGRHSAPTAGPTAITQLQGPVRSTACRATTYHSLRTPQGRQNRAAILTGIRGRILPVGSFNR
jgi:hypothetical protein